MQQTTLTLHVPPYLYTTTRTYLNNTYFCTLALQNLPILFYSINGFCYMVVANDAGFINAFANSSCCYLLINQKKDKNYSNRWTWQISCMRQHEIQDVFDY